MKSFLIIGVACFFIQNLFAQNYTGQVSSLTMNLNDTEQCIKFPAQYFKTGSGESILVVFLNQAPDPGLITIEGFYQKVENLCEKGTSTNIFMVTDYVRAQKDNNAVVNTVVGAVGSDLTQKQAQEVLDLHNKARAEVGVKPLAWSAELSEFAQDWAEHLAGSGCEMEHRDKLDKGENLYWTSRGTQNSPVDAVKAWYSEIKDFKNVELSGSSWYPTGHYSQMVWKDTTEVGMGVARCPDGGAIVVANYSPPGNYLGEKAY